ncbi:hypothetical protein [Paraburkholderia ultramafica]|uniref:hypothetical protein n=1 Tax=Paraburkholderia ultramafica TaxID=1544867 RepID=UPI0015838078|nr:hypothetical protein [Paraburkholderia ultramafica]
MPVAPRALANNGEHVVGNVEDCANGDPLPSPRIKHQSFHRHRIKRRQVSCDSVLFSAWLAGVGGYAAMLNALNHIDVIAFCMNNQNAIILISR